jgi:hypothetical protein
MFRHLMSPSSGDTHCEERWTSVRFITEVLNKTVHIDTFGSTGSNNSIRKVVVVNKKYINHLKPSGNFTYHQL